MQPVIWILFFAVFAHLFIRMMADYPALQRSGRLFLYCAFGVILVFSTLVPMLAPLGAAESGPITRRLLQAEKSIYLATTALVFLLFVFRRFFYLRVVRNVDTAFVACGLYFCGVATLLVVRGHVGPSFVTTLEIGGAVWASVCLGLGTYLFKASNERVPQFAFTPQARQEMLQAANDRIEAINGQMARALAR